MPRDRSPTTPPRPDGAEPWMWDVPPVYNCMNDDEHAQRRRRLLENLKVLSSLGLNKALQLPQLVCIGSQSAGKSSLIETLCQISLPRSSGTCTRCPIECRSRYDDQPWRAHVSLRCKLEGGGPTDMQEVPFGDEINDREELERRIAQAQLAVLNPLVDPGSYLTIDPSKRRGAAGFSCNSVIVDIAGSQQADLNFVDLPGVIVNVSDGGEAAHIELVKNMVRSYISQPAAIILLVVTCQVDYENQGAGKLAEEFDPEGRRTIGVLTKPDMMDRSDPDEVGGWIDMITGKRNVLAGGWYCVKQPNHEQRAAKVTWEEARELEERFFRDETWARVGPLYRDRLGSGGLDPPTGSCIIGGAGKTSRSAEIRIDIDRLVREVENELKELPSEPDQHPADFIRDLLDNFSLDVQIRIVQGNPTEEFDGVIQTLRKDAFAFRTMAHGTTPPIFVPNMGLTPSGKLEPAPEPLSGDKTLLVEPIKGNQFTYTYGRVEEMSKGAILRQPSDFGAIDPTDHIMSLVVDQWHRYSMDLLDLGYKKLGDELWNLVAKHFSKFSYGGLQSKIWDLVEGLLKDCKRNTERQIEFLTEQEKPARTFHDKLYLKRLEAYRGYYRSRGAMDPALTAMARVRALYEIAFQRYMDAVPMAIDLHCVRAFGKRITSCVALGVGLQQEKEVLEQLLTTSDHARAYRKALEEKGQQLKQVRRNLGAQACDV